MTDTSERLHIVRVDPPSFQTLAELLYRQAPNTSLKVPFRATLSRPMTTSGHLIARSQGMQPVRDLLEAQLALGTSPERFHALIAVIESEAAALDEHAAGVHEECLTFAEQLLG